MRNWEYKVLDARYNNLKRWFECMRDNHPSGLNSVVLLDKIIGKNGMFDFIDKSDKLSKDALEDTFNQISKLIKDYK